MSNRSPSLSTFAVASALTLCLVGCGGGGGAGAASGSDARLASLVSSVGGMDPAFEAGVTNYVVWMGGGIPSVLLTPTPVEAGATVTVDGDPPGVPLPVPLPMAGFGLSVDIVVTSPDGSTTSTYTVEVVRVVTRDLIDPTPRADDRFGHSVAVLGNGNIVVTDPYDFTAAIQAGAVHLYNPLLSVTPFASLHGGSIAALMGLGGITVLANDNFVVHSPGGVNNVGTVQLIDGSAGTQIGPTLAGSLPDDFDRRKITALANGNYVVSTSREDIGGRVDAGAVRLFSGASGTQIGVALVGDVALDRMGSDGTKALPNSNFVVLSPFDDESGVVDAGSARLMSGTTGAPVGPGLVGETTGDVDSSWFESLENGNFVLAASSYDEGGVVDAGSVRLFSSTTGDLIGAPIVGDIAGDQVGTGPIVALGNGNFVIASGVEDAGGVVDAGTVRLVSGATGAQIGLALVGETANDRLGGQRTVAVGNGNFVVTSTLDDENGIVDAGSVRLVSGSTGAQIGPALTGNQVEDFLGSERVLALGNGNVVVVSPRDDVGGIVDAGSIRLVDGTTGLQIGPTLAGDTAGDGLGASGRSTVLSNGNCAVVSIYDEEGGVSNAGSVRLFSGTLGVQLGPTLAGDVAQDRLGSGGILALGNGNFVTRSPQDNEGGVARAGSVRLVSGVSGVPLLPQLAGATSNDQERTSVAAPPHGGFFVVGFANWDNGSVDSGRVRLIAE
jgi:hypothetical protein